MPELKYENDEGVVGVTRVSNRPGFVAAFGAEPAGAPVDGVYFRKSGSQRQKGDQVRHLLCRLPDGPPTPAGQQPYRYAKVTVGTKTVFDAVVLGSTVNLNGEAYEVYGKKGEG